MSLLEGDGDLGAGTQLEGVGHWGLFGWGDYYLPAWFIYLAGAVLKIRPMSIHHLATSQAIF